MAKVEGRVNDPRENGVFGANDSLLLAPSGQPLGNGVFGFSNVPNASGVFGANNGGGNGVLGLGSGDSSGVTGVAERNGVFGVSRSDVDAGVNGRNERKGFGVFGQSEDGSGVQGHSKNGPGVTGFTQNGRGIAGFFIGGISVLGNIGLTGFVAKAAGAFKIDHPLDPANKYLLHSFVESPDMMNIYNGNVVTDANGFAVVALPDYFEALNRDLRYQLTVIGTFAQAIVEREYAEGRFTIKTDHPKVKVSWQVTGIRQDRFANKNRINVEETKSEVERGFYLHPELFGAPEENGIEWAHRPEAMKLTKESQEQMKEASARAFAQAARATGPQGE